MRKLVIVMLVVLAVLILAMPVVAQADDGGDGNVTARALAMMVVGIIAPYLTQWLKKRFGGLEARPALWIAFGVSIGLSVVALLLTGEMGWTPPPGEPIQAMTWFMEHVSVVFALSTLVYHQFISDK